ncbi:MAG: spermidine/putrescine ABC transporter substrate-binding protein, partial [Lutispora sp.]|nr:spermidine/putrescine ABC transporter substrate-binding protein [Lutispora sp.]MDD4834812.1 spermidine/putrescine ABC transporter substrate-binding protein [Lutispora sp.]
MKKILKNILVFTLAISMALSLVGCGGEKKIQLKVYNWGDYIDQSIIEDFEKKYNIDVVYDEFATNEEMYAKIKAGANDYDILVPSDYTIKRMIDEDMLHKLDMNNIPNYEYIDERFKNLAYDPNNEYSVPYMWGTVGILYNKTMVEEPVDSWKILWNEKYNKQILMLDSLRDSIGITLKMLGYSLNTKDDKELNDAKEMLIKQKPLVLAYVGDEVKDKMIGGEAALAVVWSGDAVYMKRENPDLEYVIPKEGSNIWFDAVVIPNSSERKKEAELFINYLCDSEVAFKNADFIGYATPHVEAIKKLPMELTSDKSAYPEDSDLKNSEVLEDLAGSLTKYDRIWTEVKAK